MKLQAPENENYAATVVQIQTLNDLEGCDNVVGTPLFGFQAIVGGDTEVGSVGIVFPAETQLSEEYARLNNLHRHGNLNDDEGKKGYLEDNRRVKAMKFRGHRSDCLFMPLESLKFTGVKLDDLSVGDTFDNINGHEICQKYLVKVPKTQQRLEKNKEKFVRVDKKFLPEHYDTDNYTYCVPAKTCDLYIYRVAFINQQGLVVDLAWDQVKEFCRDRGLKHVPELWRGRHDDFVVADWLDKRFDEEDQFVGSDEPVELAKESPCDEGVVIRVDGLAPYLLKAKSPRFLEHETKMLDEEVVDLETEGSTA